ncbi:hypothetical protein H2200_000608 [Cladophialophora chaetospira]|uniref:Uncharacterized protein n=1 Tax=Cladophialophora chaetospira TaxID=386627 RepID=A0AA38XNQ7_9EURO|nr:hypothetical protein H2200_000608 [Cladophialophora chaetospira]
MCRKKMDDSYPMHRSSPAVQSYSRYQQEIRSHESGPPAYEEAVYSPNDYKAAPRPNFHPQPLPQLQPVTTKSFQPSSRGKPIAIPATVAKYGSPFLRAYPPSLATYSIPPEMFLSFLDTLNRVAVKSPPLQVLGLAGNIVGFVPSAAAQIAGTAINLTAEVAAGVVQHGRTEIELKRANAELFGPRGLKVEIAKTEALVRLTGMPGVLDASGKMNKKASLLMPVNGTDFNDSLALSAQQRRLQAMEPWIAELDVTPLPEIDVPTNALSRLNVKISERERTKGEQKMLEKRSKAHNEYQKESQKAQRELDKERAKIEKDLEKDLRNIDSKLERARRRQKDRDVARSEREREKLLSEYERDKSKVERQYQKDMKEIEKDRLSDDEEEKNVRKLYWLIIREVDAPSGFGPNPDLPSQ